MYICGYNQKWLNYGHAYVLIYEDGSIYVQHGGVEMGQGLIILTAWNFKNF